MSTNQRHENGLANSVVFTTCTTTQADLLSYNQSQSNNNGNMPHMRFISRATVPFSTTIHCNSNHYKYPMPTQKSTGTKYSNTKVQNKIILDRES